MKNVQPTEVPEGAQLIDVRENDEWAVERAKGATHIPMSEITGRIQEIDPDKDICVVCLVCRAASTPSRVRRRRRSSWKEGDSSSAVGIDTEFDEDMPMILACLP